ncbi:hypothetical protein BCR44DRAFT_1428645 [Catenaria anguillulae PL171]|uniref:Uncharacterized protein n=1 Tax=Catenaria anguillulae PL171 TaxID=765915 RepID=A0A1Y2HVU2_9FUNG|nr:hypothetical protein BCR44DRAFT_1428645 [Catenaria anguillulae PL171]
MPCFCALSSDLMRMVWMRTASMTALISATTFFCWAALRAYFFAFFSYFFTATLDLDFSALLFNLAALSVNLFWAFSAASSSDCNEGGDLRAMALVENETSGGFGVNWTCFRKADSVRGRAKIVARVRKRIQVQLVMKKVSA